MINFCGNCGQKLSPTDTICPNCGKKIPSSETAESPAPDTSAPSVSTAELNNSNSTNASPDATSQPSAADPKVDRLFWTILVLYLAPLLVSVTTNILDSSSALSDILSWISALAGLAALILVIYAHIKFKNSKKITILFWVIIGLIIIRIVLMLVLMLACFTILSGLSGIY